MPRTRAPFQTTPNLWESLAPLLVRLSPEPMLLLDPEYRVRSYNEAAEEFLQVGPLGGRTLEDCLQPAGFEHEGMGLAEVLASIALKPDQGLVRLVVRRPGEKVDRIGQTLLLNDESGGHHGFALCIEGAKAREDLVQLRAKSREAAHSLNNVVMTAIGNISLSRIYATQPGEVTKHLEAAERNLLQVRDITRELQSVAKKELPQS